MCKVELMSNFCELSAYRQFDYSQFNKEGIIVSATKVELHKKKEPKTHITTKLHIQYFIASSDLRLFKWIMNIRRFT